MVEINNDSFQIELSGDTPLEEQGVLCYLQIKVLPIASPDTTEIFLTEIKVDKPGPVCITHPGIIAVKFPVKVADESVHQDLSGNYSLNPNYPNPFNSNTSIAYQLETPSDISLEIYNSMGRLISRLVDQYQESGLYTVLWNGENSENKPLSSGIYFYRLRIKKESEHHYAFDEVRKMVLLR